jgi:hypothetical protein
MSFNIFRALGSLAMFTGVNFGGRAGYPGLVRLSREQLSGGNARHILCRLAHYIAATPDRLDVVLATRSVS